MSSEPLSARHHAALHLAHRWFAFLEAPGGDLGQHLTIFDPQVRLTGRQGAHVFATDHASLARWFASIPDEVSSHHIVHADYTDRGKDGGSLRMVVAYQTPQGDGVHGSIISYETRIAFGPDEPRFVALDKTPILPNTRPVYEPSWATHRVLGLVHASLAGLPGASAAVHDTLGAVSQVTAHVRSPEGATAYTGILTAIGTDGVPSAWQIAAQDDVRSRFPHLTSIEPFAGRA